MANNNNSFNHLQWTLLIVFSIYWFIFFPLIWFVVQPTAFVASKLSTILYALIFIVTYIVLHCIIYCCLKRCEKKCASELESYAASQSEDTKYMPHTLDTALYVPKERRASKRVEPPRVPARTQSGNGTDSNRNSGATIPLYVNDTDEDADKLRFVSSYELYFDGQRFLD